MNGPLITEPRAVPVVGHDDHLPALNPAQLAERSIVGQLADAAQWQPVFSGDGGWAAAGKPLKPAAVLVPLVRRSEGLTVLLTQRTAHLRAHAGQVSFPGGRLEAADASPAHGALREAQEEVGLPPSQAQVLGHLPPYLTVTGFQVTPVVAAITPPLALTPDPHEVEDIFEVPLSFLMNPAHHRRHRVELAGRTRQFLSMPWTGVGLSGAAREYFIWGATAAMLRNLYHLLARPLSSSQ